MYLKIKNINESELLNCNKSINKLEIVDEKFSTFCESSCEKIIDYENLQYIVFYNIDDKPKYINPKIAKLYKLVNIFTYNDWTVKENLISKIGNVKYKKYMLIGNTLETPNFDNVKFLNINALLLDDFFWIRINPKKSNALELINLRQILVNLPEELEYLQLVISYNVFSLAGFEFNLPINLKIFNLYIMDCFDEVDKDNINVDYIKIPFDCDFNVYKF
jgi:hypothetical protein